MGTNNKIRRKQESSYIKSFISEHRDNALIRSKKGRPKWVAIRVKPVNLENFDVAMEITAF